MMLSAARAIQRSSEIPKFIAKTFRAFWPFSVDEGLFLPSKTDVIKETYLQYMEHKIAFFFFF